MRNLIVTILLLTIPSLLVADESWEQSSVELVQSKLNELGYSAGPVDGAWGRKTSSALSLYCKEYEHDCSGGEEQVINLLTTDTNDSYLNVEMDLASAVWFENRIGYGAPEQSNIPKPLAGL
jgi:peptidoglycan hydrolase-like protein with peptidoglycan-binding domain